jgi:hypothetical protein
MCFVNIAAYPLTTFKICPLAYFVQKCREDSWEDKADSPKVGGLWIFDYLSVIVLFM